ncbi:type II and III secretion system protein [Oligoflexus tunisiensis]|uniref:type II and III secretion system protein n=1 Tax=Oligoflexus tunisiensis TaxID=708132 RepID=UPI001C40872B|nr:type II and III secretion system protein [Oligoflexus tunisiensis]
MIRFFAAMMFLCSTLGLANPLPERWDMEMGEARRLKVNAKWSLRLSQKHILDVEEQGKGVWQVVALRSGLVYLRALDEKGTVQQSWIINVASRSESEKVERWKNLVCNEPGIHCDDSSSTVTGQTDSLAWLHKAREICDKNPPCRFRATLSSAAQRLTAERISLDLKAHQTFVDADGFVFLESVCLVPDPKRDEQWRQWIKERYGAPAQVRCQEEVDGRYRLEVVAVAQKSSDSDLDNPLHFGPIRLLPQENIDVFLQGLSHRANTKILARPRLALNLGSTLEVSDGMDIATLAPQRDQTLEIWKPVGFMLQVKLVEQRADTVKVSLNLQISRPREGQRALDRSGMQTETWLTLDQLQMVGQIQARTAGFEESRIPWLGAIPIVGALFRWNVESAADSHVYLLLRLQKLEMEVATLPPEFKE